MDKINQFHFILAGCWILYVVIHSVMATRGFKRLVGRATGSYYRYYRIVYSIIAAITLILLLAYQFSHYSPFLYTPGLLHYLAGIPLAGAGLIVMALCVKKYFINLSGVDVFIKKKSMSVLETGGLHRYVRHPLYSGTLLFIWALLLIFPLVSNLIACLIITIYTCIGIRIEEEKLVIEFGEDYRSYAASVPMLIPSFRR
jgi:methanethiol S-methyltransferase